MKRSTLLCALLAVALPHAAQAYPNGPTQYVTDMLPACASCHAVRDKATMPEVPAAYAESELAEAKHYGMVRAQMPPSPYLELTDEEKARIIQEAGQIDKDASIRIDAPNEVKAGEKITLTIKARGGNGPSIGVMLVDKPYRFQARPVTAEGWQIVDAPRVRGQSGKEQTTWLDKRIKGTPRNLGFILVMEQRYEPDKGIAPEGEVTYTLTAPEKKGDYTLTAAFLYGTENTSHAGFFQRPSGRILFSTPHRIQVR
jgi:cytochrome c553